VAGVASDGQFWISKILETLARLDKDTKHVSPLVSLDEEAQIALGKAQKQLEDLAGVSLIIMYARGLSDLREKVSTERKETARGFELVLSSLVLQCRCGEEGSAEKLEVRPSDTPLVCLCRRRLTHPRRPVSPQQHACLQIKNHLKSTKTS